MRLFNVYFQGYIMGKCESCRWYRRAGIAEIGKAQGGVCMVAPPMGALMQGPKGLQVVPVRGPVEPGDFCEKYKAAIAEAH